MKTEWSNIPGAKEYQVSNTGRVRLNGKPCPTQRTAHGAVSVRVVNDAGVEHTLQLARLVGFLFCDDFHSALRPVHKNGRRYDCAAKNLEWRTVGEVIKIAKKKQ